MMKEKKKTKEYKLNLAEVLSAIDQRKYNFYVNLPDDIKKEYSPLILMRFMSTAQNYGNYHEGMVLKINEVVNADFWVLAKDHVELLHYLMCICSDGKVLKHKWIPNTKKTSKQDWTDIIKIKYPAINAVELEILAKNMSVDEYETLACAVGLTDVEIKKHVTSFKKQKN